MEMIQEGFNYSWSVQYQDKKEANEAQAQGWEFSPESIIIWQAKREGS